MKTIFKYFLFTSLSLAVCLFMAVPAFAQRGGGGHGGGGGGGFSGGHSSGGGGGFSGGRSGGFSGGRTSSFSGGRTNSFSGGRSGSYSGGRVGTVQRQGFTTQRGSFGARSGYTGQQSRYRSGNFGKAGVNSYGSYGHGNYGHGGWGRNYGWRNHGGYFYTGGFYGSLYYPMLGLDFGYLPYGYYPFYWGDDEYYFSDGFYYQFDNDEYTVVEPPIGAAIKSLPSDAKSIVINGQQFYEQNGVYYLPLTKEDGSIEYEIAGKDGELNTDPNGNTTVVPKIGDIVTTIPQDCRKVKLNGATFYVSQDGIYYQPIMDDNNNKVYKIVGLESDNSGQ